MGDLPTFHIQRTTLNLMPMDTLTYWCETALTSDIKPDKTS